MKKVIITAVAAVLVLGVLLPAAAKEDLEQPIQVQGRVYAYYRYDLTPYENEADKGKNEFDLSRAYVRFKGKITEKVKAEVTLDADREYKYSLNQDDEGNYSLSKTRERFRVFVKYAYLDIGDLIPNHHIQGGLIKTPWIDYEQDIWGWRVLRKVGLDENGYTPSADLGVALTGDIVKGYVQHHFSFTNGEGYKNPEEFGGKTVEYRLSVFPAAKSDSLKGLSANVYARYANALLAKENVDDEKDLSYGFLVGFLHDKFDAGGGYFTRTAGPEGNETDSNFITAYGTGKFAVANGVLKPFGRVDLVGPNKDVANDKMTHIIAGCGYDFAGGWCSLVPNFQTTLPEASSAVDIREFFLHTEINF
jgi:hypothetical protein